MNGSTEHGSSVTLCKDTIDKEKCYKIFGKSKKTFAGFFKEIKPRKKKNLT
jgi:hypothetical protein